MMGDRNSQASTSPSDKERRRKQLMTLTLGIRTEGGVIDWIALVFSSDHLAKVSLAVIREHRGRTMSVEGKHADGSCNTCVQNHELQKQNLALLPG
jgi:hypothetical protein